MKARSLLVAVVLLGTACGNRQTPATPAVRSLDVRRTITLPAPSRAIPAFKAAVPKPRPSVFRALKKVQGVAVMAPIRLQRMKVRSEDKATKLRVASVQPLRFRDVAPVPSKAADFVWTALLQGEAVPTPQAARKLGLRGAGALGINGNTLSIGAFADNAVPNIADILVGHNAAKPLKLRKPQRALIGVNPNADLAAIRDRLRAAAPAASFDKIAPGVSRPAPLPVGQASGDLIGTMTYRILRNGYIEPDPAWVSANIVNAEVPILGSVMCHRLVVPQLAAALGELQRKGLARLIDPSEYGGCYVPRFIGRDPRRSLSMHAFGLAVDLNVAGNYYGRRGDMDPRVVAVFGKWGFAWGGYWSPPDPMHFELARLVRAG